MTDDAALPPVRWWQWPTILSLDAPVVAVVWQEQFARVAQVQLHGWHRLLLALSVWLIYATDRWIEGHRLTPEKVKTHRHRFYMRHRNAVLIAGLLVAATGLATAAATLTAREWIAGLAGCLTVSTYLLSHQWLHRHHPRRVPKEICVGLLFAGGCALAPALRPGAAGIALAHVALLFALLAGLNCVLISAWERRVDRSHGQTSLALKHHQARDLGRHLTWMLVPLGATLGLLDVGAGREAFLCLALGGGLLGIVDHLEPRIGQRAARVLADAVLLTPLLAFAL